MVHMGISSQGKEKCNHKAALLGMSFFFKAACAHQWYRPQHS